MNRLLLILLITIQTVAQGGDKNSPSSSGKASGIGSLRLIGEKELTLSPDFSGTMVGGLSGIDYSPKDGLYYIISDDRSDKKPARFYTARLVFDQNNFQSVTITGTTPIKQPNGTTFPNVTQDKFHVPDPEAIRFDPATGTLLWSSEGERDITPSDTVLINPFVREMKKDGSFVREFVLPDHLKMSTKEKGPRRNAVLEGLALSADGKYVYSSLEEPLYEDSPETDTSNIAPIRITQYTRKGTPVKQFAYMLESPNGVSDILAESDSRLLVLERSYTPGVGNSIHIYEVDLSHATNVLPVPALAGSVYTPASKKLILDFATLHLARLDNIEGLTWGPILSNGHRSLIVVSDNNFNPHQVTQFIVLEVLP